MKHFNRRAISAALLITLGAFYSVNASAAPASNIEQSISEMVLAQGQQVMSELTIQLQESVAEEINSFSINFSLDESVTETIAWLTDDSTTAATEVTNKITQPEKESTKEFKLLK